jgi:uncharacterized membrane protein YkvI
MEDTINKVKEWLETHKSHVDAGIGGVIGGGTATGHYWDHFTEPENLFKFYDAMLSTGMHTIIGAFLLWALRRYVFKHKK